MEGGGERSHTVFQEQDGHCPALGWNIENDLGCGCWGCGACLRPPTWERKPRLCGQPLPVAFHPLFVSDLKEPN